MTKQTKIIGGLLAGAAVATAVAFMLSSDKNGIKDKVNDWLCDLLANSKNNFKPAAKLINDQLTKANA